ncbi:MAG: SWIM zinc finger domain-containing protein [Elainellaceae cyanobacterium]
MATFSDLLDEDLLFDLAGDRYFERGVEYFEYGRVRSLAQYGDRIVAEVAGTMPYQVQLWLEDETLNSRCSCPLGVDGLFCKHCVAVALAWIDEPPAYQPAADAPAKAGTTMADVQEYLARQTHETLVQMILDRALEDSGWREELLLKAAIRPAAGANGETNAEVAVEADIETFRQALHNAIIVVDFVDYYHADEYIDGVQTAVNGLEDLLDAGYPDAVIELCEEALYLLEDAFNAVDDSSGYLGMVADDIETLHRQACEIAQPDPQALAERLFKMELQSGFGFFHQAVETYADVLGEAGIAAYQKAVDAEARYLAYSDSKEVSNYSSRRRQIRRMQESLIAITGDAEALVAAIAKDLAHPDRYWQIIEIYQGASQMEAAIDWAKRGAQAFSQSHWQDRFDDFLVDAYEQQGQHDAALETAWSSYTQRPIPLLYQRLKHQADKTQAWSQWRERALARMREALEEANRKVSSISRGGRSQGISVSLLVEVLLWEGDVERAWQEAQTGECRSPLLLRLADLRTDEHPQASLAIYQAQVEPLVNQTNNEAYRNAVHLLFKVRDIMLASDREDEFDAYLEQLVKTYKRKRNFVSMLKGQGLA